MKMNIEDKLFLLHYKQKELFNKSSDKIILDEFDQRMYTNFWTEYDDLLNSIIKSTVTSAFYL